MNVTFEGLMFLAKILALSSLVGFSFTAGVWAFCWGFSWAPVNINVNTTIYEDQNNG